MLSVCSDKCTAYHYKCMVCSVQCLMCSMKCTGADSSVFAGAGAVRSVHCAVYSVPATDEHLAVETE